LLIGDTDINLSLVSLIVFEDASTFTVHFAFGGDSAKFHTGDTTPE